MAPVDNPDFSEACVQLVRELRRLGVTDVHADKLNRALYSTDACNYRVVPELIVAPKTTDELLATLDAARTLKIPVTSRGTGTSCAGNAIGPGLIIDYARHLNQIIDLDPASRTAVVQPGVIQGQLQTAAAPHGLRFGPDPSTSNRCTIGGMIGNNACGPHATAWGRTADNVDSLECVDGLGRRFTATSGDQALQVIPGLEDLVLQNLATIRPNFGRFKRQVAGYSLEHLLPENGRNLAAALVGSEGTLVAVTQATVKLVPAPKAPVLVALGYPNMIAAADDVPALLSHHPLAVEGLDKRLVDVVRQHKGPGAVPPLPEGEGWLFVEVGGEGLETEAAALDAAEKLVRSASAIDAKIYPPGTEAAALWRIRADGAGLGGRAPLNPDGSGNQQGWPGFEDAAVPPEKLGGYLRDFTALMKEKDVDGLIYGHFGDGCVHVRLDLPLGSQAGVGKSHDFLTSAAKLIASHGGSVSGEHGDGRARSELLQYMYDPAVITLFENLKDLFDPENLMNPGVMVRPDPLTKNLRRPAAHELPKLPPNKAGFDFRHDQGSFTTAVHRCTGVAKCHANNAKAGGFMCPSFLASGLDEDSTRGRARILQELANGSLISGLDAPEVERALDLCLACKACSSDCPAGIDMARYRSEILHRRYLGKVRPITHYLLGRLPAWLRLAQNIPFVVPIVNSVMGVGPIRRLAFRIGGIDPRRQMPLLSSHSFSSLTRWLEVEYADTITDQQLQQGSQRYRSGDKETDPDGHESQAETRTLASEKPMVCVWVDSFSHSLDTRAAQFTVKILKDAGYRVVTTSPRDCCGLTRITTGQLPQARRLLKRLLGSLTPFAVNGIPIVGVEPSCTAVLRDDLPELIPDDPRAEVLSKGVYTLAELLTAPEPLGPGERWNPPDLSDKEIVAQPHCHHYSVMGWEADRQLLQKTGAKVTELAGCCGLAGNFGMEAGHYEMSVKVAHNSLLPALEQQPEAVYLADGFSCRTQAEQLAGRTGIHLAELLSQSGDVDA